MMELTKEEWKAEMLRILTYVDKVLTSKGLWYSLAYGSVLGAVREKGFIPWDRDADIIIKLPDRDAVRKALKDNIPDDLEYFDSSEDKQFCFDNIRSKKNKEFVFVDIFALYGAPDITKMANRDILKILMRNKFCVKVFGAKYGNPVLLQKKYKLIPYLLIKSLLHCIPNKVIRKVILNYEMKYDYNQATFLMTMATYRRANDIMPKDIFDKTIRQEFEGIELNIPAEFHRYLSLSYGDDYMIPKQTGWQ